MSAREVLRMDGHLVDSLLLAKVLDAIVAAGASYRILELDLGTTNLDQSHVRLEVEAAGEVALERLLESLHVHGLNREDSADAALEPADADGVLPDGFYATTNFVTAVRLGGHWLRAANPEMDCAIVVDTTTDPVSARTVPMHRVHRGDMVVVGWNGVRVEPPEPPRARPDTESSADGGGHESFGFMTSDVSSEKPKALVVARVAASLEAARSRRDQTGAGRAGPGSGSRVLVVAGPAVVHTGAAADLAWLVREGFVSVLFAGNGFATHDIEAAVLGTSLGVSVDAGAPQKHGHANHLRVINSLRRLGSIRAAVEAGWLTSGVLYECVRAGVPVLLGGSVRDDGPLPDVITDTVRAADAMREQVAGVSVALMLASTLHAIATGNLLPAGVETYCVDINQAVVTKLADRGSHQAFGIVTDVGLFVRELAVALGRRGP